MCKKGGPRCPSSARSRLLSAKRSYRRAQGKAAGARTERQRRIANESLAKADERLTQAASEYALTEAGIASARASGMPDVADRLQAERARLLTANGSDGTQAATVQEQREGDRDDAQQQGNAPAISDRDLERLRDRYVADAAVAHAGKAYAGRVWAGTDPSGDRLLHRHELAVDGRTVAVKQSFTVDPEAAALYRSAELSTAPIFELDSKAECSTFRDAIGNAASGHRFGSSVAVYDTEAYADMRTFLAKGGKAGFALKEGDEMVSVFNDDSNLRGLGSPMVELAIQQGARRGDAFDVMLPQLYARNGFDVVARLPWNDQYKPDGWDKTSYAAFNNGEPDVVFFAYRPDGPRRYVPGQGKVVDDYDEGVAAAAAAAKEWSDRC